MRFDQLEPGLQNLVRYAELCMVCFMLFMIGDSVWKLIKPEAPLSLGSLPFFLGFTGLLVLYLPMYLYIRPPSSLLAIGVFMLVLISLVAAFIAEYAVVFRVLGVHEANEEFHDTGRCLYLSIITWTTVGYGDITPTTAARFWAASEALVGLLSHAIFIGTIAALFNKAWEDNLPLT